VERSPKEIAKFLRKRIETTTGILARETPLSQQANSLFMGTNVVSGSAKTVVVGTGPKTEFGKVSERLRLKLE